MTVETVVLDVGARYGIHPTWRGFGGELRYIMFEPDPVESTRLSQKYRERSDLKVEAVALGERRGQSLMKVLRHRGQSSMLSPNPLSNWFSKVRPGEGDQVGEYLVDMTTVDLYCAKNNIIPDFIKTDTEGSDLSVLAGAEGCLEKLIGIRTEIHFEQVFTGAPTFADMFHFLTRHGFITLNLDYDGRGSPINKYYAGDRYGLLTGTDAVWIKRVEDVLTWTESENEKATYAAKYALFCFANNASDLAMEMLLSSSQACQLLELQGTRLLASLDVAVQNLFYTLLQHPAYSSSELGDVYSRLFRRPLKARHEFFESDEFNPT
jgi:FkbM family methyltransferase